MIRFFILFFLATGVFEYQPAAAQPVSRYNTFSYSVNEGLLQTTIGDIAVDKNNYCWISFPNGIQKFDGNSFTSVPVQHGLPDDKYVHFFRCKNGDLLIGHLKGISRYNAGTNDFSLVYKQPAPLQSSVVFIGEEENIIYTADEYGVITSLNSDGYQPLSSFKTGLSLAFSDVEKRPRFSNNIISHKAALRIASTVYLLDLRERKVIRKSEIPGLVYSFLFMLKSDNELLYYDYKTSNALQSWDFQTNNNTTLRVHGKESTGFSRCVLYTWKNKMLVSFDNRLYETDSTLRILKSELVNFQNQPVAGTASVHKIKEDNFGNLYLQTVNGGIRKIIRNNYPIKYFGVTGLKNNNILAVLPDKKNNRIFTGGNGGLFVFDTLQRLIKHFSTMPGLKNSFTPNGILQSSDGDYFIFSVGANKVWRINNKLSVITPLAIKTSLTTAKSRTGFFGNVLYNNGNTAIFQTQEKLYHINFTSNQITEHQFSDTYILSGLIYKNSFFSHGRDELIFLDGRTFKEIRKIPFKEPAGVRCFAIGNDGALYTGGNKGVFKIDTTGRILQQWNKSTGLPDECIYTIAFDKTGAMWCSTNKGIFRIDNNNDVLQLTKEDGLQENEFNTNVLAVASDGELYFAGVNGVSSFFPESISQYDDRPGVLLTALKVNNETVNIGKAVWDISKLVLPYRQNSFAFDFVAMGNSNSGRYVYQYKMEGVDKEWIQNNGLQTVRYSLAPGKYTFQLYASRLFNKEAKPLKTIKIIIRPPFWKTVWFWSSLVLLALVILYYIINQRNKRRYEHKLQQLENEKQLKQERERISKDLHDNLGAYANAVLYNAGLLEKEKDEEKRMALMEDVKFSSKDIITSLRETVWALKKEEYTAEDCLVRIRNFIQPFAKYYTGIHFKIEGEAPVEMKFHYTKALNLVRIVQEAVSNSIKHASPSAIIITCKPGEKNWEITVADNGKGFNYTTIKDEEKGNGLNNMKHRADESGFLFSIKSTMNTGTSVKIII